MARAALLLNLVRTGIEGDIESFTSTARAIASEERNKRHHSVADELTRIIADHRPQSNVTPITQASQVSWINNSEATGFIKTVPQISLNDLTLNESVQLTCQDIIDEHQNAKLLRQNNLIPRHKILLYGPPGNGKTSLAEALAQKLMLPLIKINYDEIISKYLGESTKALTQLFQQIEQNRCVVFFDEFEVLSKERADNSEVGEIKRIVSSLLLHMDNLNPNVILIAATNHSQMLDSAVWRRFDVCLALENPQLEQQQQWIKQFSNNVGFDFNLYKDQIMSHTKGCSYAELEKLLLVIWRKFVIRGKNGDINPIIEQAIAQWQPNN